jgi:O-Antigen ligase
MQSNSRSLAAPPMVFDSPAFGVRWAKTANHDSVFLYASLLILLFSTVDTGPLGNLVKSCWLISFVALALTNIGAAFVVYIGSLAVYSPLHFESMTSLLQRPDNLAVPILFAAMAFQIYRRQRQLRSVNLYVVVLLFYFLAHGIVFAPEHLPALIRDCVIPFAACILAAWIGFGEREITAFQDGLIAIGCYTGFASILERTPLADRVLPFWIGNPSLRPFDLYQDQWLEYPRSGGTLLQPAFNGLLLAMIVMIILLRSRKGITPYHMFAASLCIAGSFFTYTRGAWLSILLPLLWLPGWTRTSKQANVRRALLIVLALASLAIASGAASERLKDGGTILFRLNLWGAALRLAASHPLQGVGFFNFGSAMTSVQQGFGISELKFRKVEEGVASHNTALTILVEFGLPAFALYVFAFCKLVQRARENCRKLIGVSGPAWVIAFTIAYLTSAQFISCFEGTVNTIFFGFLGILAGARDTAA